MGGERNTPTQPLQDCILSNTDTGPIVPLCPHPLPTGEEGGPSWSPQRRRKVGPKTSTSYPGTHAHEGCDRANRSFRPIFHVGLQATLLSGLTWERRRHWVQPRAEEGW